MRAQICASHRFQSFAGERTQNFVKWCVLDAPRAGLSSNTHLFSHAKAHRWT